MNYRTGDAAETSCVMETLESRLLLSSALGLSAEPAVVTFDMGEQIAIRASGPSSSETAQLSTYDAGDSYAYFDETIPLLRAAGSVVFELHGDSEASTMDALTAETGILKDYTLTSDFYGNGIYRAQAPLEDEDGLSRASTEALRDALSTLAGIAWAAPLFVNGQTGLYQFAANELILTLEDGSAIETDR